MNQPQGLDSDNRKIYDCPYCDLNYFELDKLIDHAVEKHINKVPKMYATSEESARTWFINVGDFEVIEYGK